MKLTRWNTYVVTFLGVIALWSCGTAPRDDNKAGEFDSANVDINDRIQDLAYEIPSPHEIPYLLQATGAEFNQSLLSNRRKADSYLARNEKAALNLGVYAADVGYLSSYDKTQEAIDYLSVVKMLAENLGVIGSFNSDMLKKFESNISNKDSLATLIDQAVQ